MDRLTEQRLRKLEKQEEKWLTAKENRAVRDTIEKIETKIPQGVREKLEAAFYQAFQLVFSKGTKIIERTYDKEKLKAEHDILNYTYDKNRKRKALGAMKRGCDFSAAGNLGIAALEGTVLGAMGIGLPDIPVFITVLLKGIYQTALDYGFSYETKSEQLLILAMIEAALSPTEEREARNRKVGKIMEEIDGGLLPDGDFDRQMRDTADVLAMEMLCIKFIQGAPVVGAVAGLSNAVYFQKIIGYVKLKYQKRYLLSKSGK